MQVSIHQAKTQLSQLLRRVAAGEEVIIANRDRPIARLVAFASRSVGDLDGDLTGKIHISHDFDAIPEGFEDYT